MRRELTFLGSSWLLVVACAASVPPKMAAEQRTTPSEQVRTSSGASPSTASPDPGASGELRARHGGVLMTERHADGRLDIEVVVERDGTVRLFALDAEGHQMAPENVAGAVTCERGAVKTTVTITSNQATGAVEGHCAELGPPETTVSYVLKVRGIGATGELHVPPTGTAGMTGHR